MLLFTACAAQTPGGADTITEPAALTAQVTGTLLRENVGLYPRVVQLGHNGPANGRILASVVTFENGDGLGAIHESTDGGETSTQVGTVADPDAADGQGFCCATLYKVPRRVGDTPAGTLL